LYPEGPGFSFGSQIVSLVRQFVFSIIVLKIVTFNKSYCSTVHFRRITSIYQPTNAHKISHKTHLKHFKTPRHVSILSDNHQGILLLAKLYYSIHNSIRSFKRGVVTAYHVVWECVVEQWLCVRRRTPSHCSTTHSHTTCYAATTPRFQVRIEL